MDRHVTTRCRFWSGALAALWLASAGVSCSFRIGSSVRVREWTPHPAFKEVATRVDESPLTLAAGETISIEVPHGQVGVTVANDDDPKVIARVEMRGRTKSEAESNLARYALSVERHASGARVTISGEPLEIALDGREYKIEPRVDLRVTVPRDVLLEVDTEAGEISAVGPLASCDLETGFGDVSASGISGDVRIRSGSGDVELESVRGGAIDVASSFGSLTLSGLKGSTIRAGSDSGKVTARRLDAESIDLRSGFGDIRLTSAAGEVRVHSSSGSIEIAGAGKGQWELESGFGRVSIEGGSGVVTANSSSGDVRINGFQGSATASSGFGEVLLHGRFDAVTASSSSGAVSVVALKGSRVETPWTVTSKFGDVVLKAPSSFSCSLAAKTGFGSIHADFPITVEAGSLDRNRLEGKVGAGGPEVLLRTSSGKIVLERLDD